MSDRKISDGNSCLRVERIKSPAEARRLLGAGSLFADIAEHMLSAAPTVTDARPSLVFFGPLPNGTDTKSLNDAARRIIGSTTPQPRPGVK